MSTLAKSPLRPLDRANGADRDDLRVEVLRGQAAIARCVERGGRPFLDSGHPSALPEWLPALAAGLRQEPILLVARRRWQPQEAGHLPLLLMRSPLFGRFLVGLPYVSTGGVYSSDPDAAGALVHRASELADETNVRFLELRHEERLEHPRLTGQNIEKVSLRLPLPEGEEELWNALRSRVRNQVRKGLKQGFTVHWGGAELLPEFCRVVARRMRQLGTPDYGRRLFANVLQRLPQRAEICCVRDGRRPIAVALLVHGTRVTETPTAAALVEYNPRNANMLMYWHLLLRSVERGQECFDFGRSSRDSGTFRFKNQWGALPHASVWQYYLRRGELGQMRPDHPKYQRWIRLWRRLPLWVTRTLGPQIVRGIP